MSNNLPILFERIESIAIFIGFVWLYSRGHYSWLVFALLIFSIDIFMLGYLANPKIGAVIYNTGHNYATPLVLGLATINWTNSLLPYLVIWCAHIAMDRALGYGLKFTTRFQDTHLGTIGK